MSQRVCVHQCPKVKKKLSRGFCILLSRWQIWKENRFINSPECVFCEEMFPQKFFFFLQEHRFLPELSMGILLRNWDNIIFIWWNFFITIKEPWYCNKYFKRKLSLGKLKEKKIQYFNLLPIQEKLSKSENLYFLASPNLKGKFHQKKCAALTFKISFLKEVFQISYQKLKANPEDCQQHLMLRASSLLPLYIVVNININQILLSVYAVFSWDTIKTRSSVWPETRIINAKGNKQKFCFSECLEVRVGSPWNLPLGQLCFSFHSYREQLLLL